MIPTVDDMRAAARASIDRPTDWEVAFHEAGHVVVEVAVAGSYPDFVYLSDDPTADHAGRTVGRSFIVTRTLIDAVNAGHVTIQPPPPGTSMPALDLAAMVKRQRHQFAAVLLAGDLARELALDYRVDVSEIVCEVEDGEVDSGTDVDQLRALVADLSPADAETVIEDAAQAALVALRARWDDVRTVAAALVARRRLDREDLFDLL